MCVYNVFEFVYRYIYIYIYTQRKDDTVEALQSRLKSYYELTVPILDHYSKYVVHMDCNENTDAELSEKQVMNILMEQNLIPRPPTNVPDSIDNSLTW